MDVYTSGSHEVKREPREIVPASAAVVTFDATTTDFGLTNFFDQEHHPVSSPIRDIDEGDERSPSVASIKEDVHEEPDVSSACCDLAPSSSCLPASSSYDVLQSPSSSGISPSPGPSPLMAQGGYDSSNPATPSPTPSGKPDSNYAPADSNTCSPSKSFVPCKVCGDKASGYHYGVTSCEGCKGFFRRSIQKQIEYRCLRDGKCLIIRLNRNRCQFCRFKKCLAVGMSRDSVRYGRVPKRSRERLEGDGTLLRPLSVGDEDSCGGVHPHLSWGHGGAQSDMTIGPSSGVSHMSPHHSSKSPYPSPDSLTSPVASRSYQDVITAVSQAHFLNCPFTEERCRHIVKKLTPIAIPEAPSESPDTATSSAETLEQQKISLWQSLAHHMTPSIQLVVEFAKRIPGFCDLGQDDQLILIKVGFFEIWLTQISRMIAQTSDSSITFTDGSFFTRQQLELIFDEEFVSSLFSFSASFSSLGLSDLEVALFSSILLLTSDRPGLTDQKTIEQLQNVLLEALKQLVMRNHTVEPQLFSCVLMKLPELKGLGVAHCKHLTWFRQNWRRVTLPPLFAEVFDVPKSEEDV